MMSAGGDEGGNRGRREDLNEQRKGEGEQGQLELWRKDEETFHWDQTSGSRQ